MEYDLEKFFEASLDMLCIAGTDGYFKRVNPAFERMLGIDSSELLSKPFIDFIHPEDVEPTRQAWTKLVDGTPLFSLENRCRCADGTYRHLLWSSYPEQETGLLYAVAKDITELKRMQQELTTFNRSLSQLASTDPLTNLSNRRALFTEVERYFLLARRQGRSLSFLLLDVDHFKKYNDTFGHLAGDEALQTVATILSTTARGSDIVGRYGGEEFAVGLPETDQNGAMRAAERFLQAIANHPWPKRLITVSIGVSTITPEKSNTDENKSDVLALVSAADQALYHSKRAGRNCFTHFAEIGEDSLNT